ncbi:MAG: hypothetical protein FWC27_08415 [Firmicutes bacterium]|nr:hypothetical protein [Bacillota bacterium]
MQQEYYLLRTDNTGGEQKYYAAFSDSNGIRQEIEVSREVYLVLGEYRRDERRQLHYTERHHEQLELSEMQLAQRIAKLPVPLDDLIVASVDMQAALLQLTAVQRRRFLLCCEYGLNCQQIADKEGCTARAVEYSVSTAKARLKKYFEE